jgi:putative hydrolase of the HAD superfamily
MTNTVAEAADRAEKIPPGNFMAIDALAGAEAWVFDLDNTLYPASSNLFAQIDDRMRGFIAEYLGIPGDQAREIQKSYFLEYGTTLRGLMDLHGIDPRLYLKHVHDIDITPVAPDPALKAVLAKLGGRKIIFTNATRAHARRVMERLGVSRHFEAVFDIENAGFIPKPRREIYEKLVADHGLDPARTVMIEDIARNLVPAAEIGMTTVWVRSETRWGKEGANIGGGGAGHIHHQTDDLAGWLAEIVAAAA